MPVKYPHVVEAEKYAKAVVSGDIPACSWTRLACKRHLDDKEKRNFKYRFDRAKAEKVCRFMERLPHIKGKWARQRLTITLEPWQCFILCCVFGWVDKVTGLRRFKTVYIEVPRKNAKSTLSSGVALYMLCDDDEFGAECYSAATSQDQAKIVFNVAKEMARRSQGFKQRFGVTVQEHNLSVLSTASLFKALSAEGSNLDGLNPNFACNDEVHAQKTREVYDVLDSALGARDQALLWNITTAGTNRAGICYELHTYVKKILQGIFEDDSFFGIIYSIDEDDDWTKPETWIKANPNYGVSVFPEDIERLCVKAMQVPSAQSNFLTKRLNVWCNADSAWMDMVSWDRQADPNLKIEDFKGEECITTVDLSSKIDIASKGHLFVREIDGKEHFYFFCDHYLPEETVEDSKNSQYDGWARSGHLILTDGNIIDIGMIEDDIKSLPDDGYQVKEVGYDPFQATQMATRLMDDGFNMVEVRPTVPNFSEPMKELEALVIDGRFHHDGDPVLTWMVSNVVCHRDNKDNIYPRKEIVENKIDGVICAIMALARYIAPSEDKTSIYDNEDLVIG